MAEVPSTHCVKSDDVYIAYQVLGEGPLDLMFVPGFVSNVEAIWQSPNRSRFLRRLASFCRVIIFDKRGTGMSDRSARTTYARCAEHLERSRFRACGAVWHFRGRPDVLAVCRHLSGTNLGSRSVRRLYA